MNQTTQQKQQQYLQKFIHNYNQRTKKSKQITQQSRPFFADHKASIIFTVPFKEICYPIAGDRSVGSKIWDIDGNEYLDFSMGYGVNLFGHNPPFIKQAIEEQLDRGIHLGLGSEIACEVAQMICELTNMERVALSNTGTEAVMTAIRLARTATNRHKIALFSGSYHGHFDGTLVKAKTVDGIRQNLPLAKIVTKLDRLGQIAPVFCLFFSTKILIKGDLSPSTSRLQPLLAESLSSFV